MRQRWLLIAVLGGALAFSAQAQQSAFAPANGFAGKSEGNGSLRLLFGKPRPYHVDSLGNVQPDGTFRLDQTVTFQGQPAKRRSWIIRETTPFHYTGTLSDAAGAVSGRTGGGRLFLEYRIKGPLVMHQSLELSSDRTTINNVGRLTFLGIPVGSLHEIIRRLGP